MKKEEPDIFARDWQPSDVAVYFSALTAADEGYASGVTASMKKDGVRGDSVSAMEGRLLETFARLSGGRKAVEIGALYGYSAHWIARGLPEGGRLYSLEKDPACVQLAKEAVEASGLSRKVTVMEGPAKDSLKTLSKLAPFDFCFIDAEPELAPDYLRWAAANLRPGGVALADKTFLKGRLSPGDISAADNTRARAMREFFHVLFDSDRFASASVIPTGGGFAVGIK
ncbi:MAG TPA: O-methyltransferase [Elusimicrobiales bacterium]|nr:O-methyltransferase [Elusimicrobiales bacterium]